MRHINGVYTQRYNRMNNTDGPLFRGRYKSILIDSDSYLLHLSKYIHLNPLEARIVDDLSQYRWSSYNSYIGDCSPPSWLIRSDIYGQLTTLCVTHLAYQLFMSDKYLDKKITNFYGKKRYSPVLGTESLLISYKFFKWKKFHELTN